MMASSMLTQQVIRIAAEGSSTGIFRSVDAMTGDPLLIRYEREIKGPGGELCREVRVKRGDRTSIQVACQSNGQWMLNSALSREE